MRRNNRILFSGQSTEGRRGGRFSGTGRETPSRNARSEAHQINTGNNLTAENDQTNDQIEAVGAQFNEPRVPNGRGRHNRNRSRQNQNTFPATWASETNKSERGRSKCHFNCRCGAHQVSFGYQSDDAKNSQTDEPVGTQCKDSHGSKGKFTYTRENQHNRKPPSHTSLGDNIVDNKRVRETTCRNDRGDALQTGDATETKDDPSEYSNESNKTGMFYRKTPHHQNNRRPSSQHTYRGNRGRHMYVPNVRRSKTGSESENWRSRTTCTEKSASSIHGAAMSHFNNSTNTHTTDGPQLSMTNHRTHTQSRREESDFRQSSNNLEHQSHHEYQRVRPTEEVNPPNTNSDYVKPINQKASEADKSEINASYMNGCRPKTRMNYNQNGTDRREYTSHFGSSRGANKDDTRRIETQHLPESKYNLITPTNDSDTAYDQTYNRDNEIERRKERPSLYGFPFLKNLKDKDASHIVLALTRSTDALTECIKRAESEHELLELLLEVLSIAFTSREAPSSMIKLFEVLKAERFFDTMTLYLLSLQPGLEESATKEIVKARRALSSLLKIIWGQITRNPSSLSAFLIVFSTMSKTIELIAGSKLVNSRLLSEFQEFAEHKKDLEKANRRTTGNKEQNAPPDNFRHIPIMPTTPEIKGQIQPFLRKNKINGEYDDLEHYLDVQFRLLREDFVGPLREGITDHIRQAMSKDKKENRRRNTDIRLYEHVWIYAPVINDHGLCYKIQFEMTNRMKNIKWEASKRLIYGSLVCLSDDDFTTFLLATVVDNDNLNAGQLVIQLDQENISTSELMLKTYTMAESSAYFEPYRHVLASLQTFQAGDLPFEQYIVFCETSSKPPIYVNEDTVYDLRPLVDDTFKIQERRRLIDEDWRMTIHNSNLEFTPSAKPAEAVKVTDDKTWPSKTLLQLDESQLRAVKDALSKEFAIIQGPPGTGKTYIGLKIAKALLHNKSEWLGLDELGHESTRPMLIVCFTNHALDQFLEGIVGFFQGDVVRVGSRSSSTMLANHSLKRYRQSATGKHPVVTQMKQVKEDARKEVRRLSTEIDVLLVKIEIYLRDVVHETFLREIIGQQHFLDLDAGYEGQRSTTQFSVLVQWLGINDLKALCRRESQGQAARNQRHESENIEPDTGLRDKSERMLNEIVLDPAQKIKHSAAIRKLRGEVSAYFVCNKQKENLECGLEDLRTQQSAHKSYLRKLTELGKKRWLNGDEYYQLQMTKRNITNLKNEQARLKGLFDEEKDFLKRMEVRLRRLLSARPMTNEEVSRIGHVWRLQPNDRWRLYSFWIQLLCQELYTQVDNKRAVFKAASDRLHEAELQEDKEILKLASVVGMTTTAAAKYQSVLREIQPRIVIVEEAAEVLESHIITTLSRDCDHLILIGDHKQLRPNPTVHNLAVKFNLNISLFERMIKNDVRYNSLQLQHRMRPEIANVMRHIYPDLKDHTDVTKYSDVKGVSTNILFINHRQEEQSSGDTQSYSNPHEAAFAAALCKYLLKQEYPRQNITILTTYTGQLFEMRKHMPKEEFEGVRVTVVDNYQGEENDIVILSLVRSNPEDKIGFLKIENRICVALSRAKIGFYVLGNFNQLAAQSKLWRELKFDMENKGFFSEGLKLYCQNHPTDKAIIATNAKDFDLAPEGGCTKICQARLPCCHACERFCHISDKSHELYKCQKACTKSCELNHNCKRKCFEECPPCDAIVTKAIPKCGHNQEMPCHRDPHKFTCQVKPCPSKLKCGHPCKEICGAMHSERCYEKVEYTWQSCGHSSEIPCWKTGKVKCPNPCESELKCGHICGGTCGRCLKGRFHDQCVSKCGRILVCGHECKDKCNNCPPCSLNCENRCVHSRCTKLCGEPCDPCKEKCSWKCNHYQCTQLCSEPCDRPPCNEPCQETLPCEHPCIGLCGEQCPDLCRICDAEKVTEILFGSEDEPDAQFVYLADCGHVIEYKAMDTYMARTDEDTSIQMKGCPRCKTPIRKSVRYGNEINSRLMDFEQVKQSILGDENEIQNLAKDINQTLDRDKMYRNYDVSREEKAKGKHDHSSKRETELERLQARNHFMDKNASSKQQLLTLQNQLKIVKAIHGLNAEIRTTTLRRNELLDTTEKVINKVEQKRSYLSEQEIDDIKREVFRIETYLRFVKLQKGLQSVGKTEKAATDMAKIKEIVLRDEILTDEDIEELKSEVEIVNEFLKFIPGLGIDEDERLSIVAAMKLTKGHWFKCPNGHVYAIGDCGGANQKGICPECKADIGGERHSLTTGNKLAPEMDGASFAAYSEEANNLGNFNLEDLH